MSLLRWIVGIPSRVMIGLVRFYQVAISPLMGPSCKFQPTCSAYFIECVRKYGAIRGGLKGVWRVFRCGPWSKGGHDPP